MLSEDDTFAVVSSRTSRWKSIGRRFQLETTLLPRYKNMTSSSCSIPSS